jgi:subtilase family serine protease
MYSRISQVLVGALALFCLCSAAAAQVRMAIDETRLVTLAGNTRPEAAPANDAGMLPDRAPLTHLQLLLRRPDRLEKALDDTIDALHDRNSPQFHKWLSARELGARFGPSEEDVNSVERWLASHGFQVDGVLSSRMIIAFDGSAGAVREAFHTPVHALRVKGEGHFANMRDPQIPAALAPIVEGIVSLHDFAPHPTHATKTGYSYGVHDCWPLTNGVAGACYALVPADLATIYNFNPAFSAGNTGAGQTVVAIENTDVYSADDWTTFRSTFGLSGYTTGSFTQIHPKGSLACDDPGVVANSEQDAILDAEWASAAAPGAAIVIASCKSTATFGGLIALENLLEGSSRPASVSVSYQECETFNGATANATYNEVYKQAVAEGVAVFVSTGDDAAANCDVAQTAATHGIGVSGMASSPYDVAVGGTDFGDANAGTLGVYWKSSNSSVYGSAKSYIPEIPWSDSCASVLMALWYSGSKLTYGSNGYCNSGPYHTNFLTTIGGSGGPSGCAKGTPSIRGVVSGSCKGWKKPSWQSGFAGLRDDGVRDLPDVSLFAGNGIWSHFYIFCDSDGSLCSGVPSNWGKAGGTSFSTPILAGVQALINQKTGESWGNPNVSYYALAVNEYGAGGIKKCNSSKGKNVDASCVFYDVTEGDNDIDCTGTYNCFLPSGTYGVLSTNDGKYKPAYRATTGWDFPTGIGTINVANLLSAWSKGAARTNPPSP